MGAARQTRSVASLLVRDEEVTEPRAAHLRHLIRMLIGDTTTPLEIRKECDTLMLAINANDLTAITDCLARLRRLADTKGFTLPNLQPEPARTV